MERNYIIANNIQKLRTKYGLSQEDLAFKLHVSRQSISKWESGRTIPEISKIINLTKIFKISSDEILFDEAPKLIKPSKNILNWGMYLKVKNFKLSNKFYELLLERKSIILGAGRFAQFRFNGNCILSIMNETHLHEDLGVQKKVVLNLITTNLKQEHERLIALKIGPVTEITSYHPTYHFFTLLDPDFNLIEIAGEYYEAGILNKKGN